MTSAVSRAWSPTAAAVATDGGDDREMTARKHARAQARESPADMLYSKRVGFARRGDLEDPMSGDHAVPQHEKFSRWSGHIDDEGVGKGGDIVRGSWSCCRKLARDAKPCVDLGPLHTRDIARCINCGMFFHIGDNERQRVLGHPNCAPHGDQEPVCYSLRRDGRGGAGDGADSVGGTSGAPGVSPRQPHPFGSSLWLCCNAVGVQNSRFHFLTGAERKRLDSYWTEQARGSTGGKSSAQQPERKGLQKKPVLYVHEETRADRTAGRRIEDRLNVRESWGCGHSGYHVAETLDNNPLALAAAMADWERECDRLKTEEAAAVAAIVAAKEAEKNPHDMWGADDSSSEEDDADEEEQRPELQLPPRPGSEGSPELCTLCLRPITQEGCSIHAGLFCRTVRNRLVWSGTGDEGGRGQGRHRRGDRGRHGGGDWGDGDVDGEGRSGGMGGGDGVDGLGGEYGGRHGGLAGGRRGISSVPRRERCPNEGCSAFLLPDDLAKHAKTCQHKRWACPNKGCEANLKIREKTAHERSCPFRKVPCSWADSGCKETPIAKEAAEHASICVWRPSKCAYFRFGCRVTLPTCQIGPHEASCPQKRVSCIYDGCNVLDYPDAVVRHQQTCPMKKVICGWDGCALQFPDRDAEIHAKMCPHRIVECPYDKCDVTTKAQFMGDHKRTCGWRPNECSNARFGCRAVPPLNELATHVAYCEYRQLSCTHEGCAFSTSARDMQTHLAACPYGIVTCVNCKAQMQRAEEKKHTVHCPKKPTLCPNAGCGVIMPACQLIEHVDKKCTYRQVPCKNLGCTDRPPLHALATHQETCPHRLLTCKNEGCGQTLKAVIMASHRHSCPFRIVRCPFAGSTEGLRGQTDSGCREKITARKLAEHREKCPYRPVRCAVGAANGCTAPLRAIDAAEHEAECPYRLVPCPTGYCEVTILAKDRKAHAKQCQPRCLSGVHNFTVCNFRCLRKAYPTVMLRIFNPYSHSVQLPRGARFEDVAAGFYDAAATVSSKGSKPGLQFSREDIESRLDPCVGYVVEGDTELPARARRAVRLCAREKPGPVSKMMASPVSVHWKRQATNRYGEPLGACQCLVDEEELEVAEKERIARGFDTNDGRDDQELSAFANSAEESSSNSRAASSTTSSRTSSPAPAPNKRGSSDSRRGSPHTHRASPASSTASSGTLSPALTPTPPPPRRGGVARVASSSPARSLRSPLAARSPLTWFPCGCRGEESVPIASVHRTCKSPAEFDFSSTTLRPRKVEGPITEVAIEVAASRRPPSPAWSPGLLASPLPLRLQRQYPGTTASSGPQRPALPRRPQSARGRLVRRKPSLAPSPAPTGDNDNDECDHDHGDGPRQLHFQSAFSPTVPPTRPTSARSRRGAKRRPKERTRARPKSAGTRRERRRVCNPDPSTATASMTWSERSLLRQQRSRAGARDRGIAKEEAAIARVSHGAHEQGEGAITESGGTEEQGHAIKTLRQSRLVKPKALVTSRREILEVVARSDVGQKPKQNGAATPRYMKPREKDVQMRQWLLSRAKRTSESVLNF